MKMCEDDSGIRWSRLNKQSFKQMLSERYGKKISERMVAFIEKTYG